MTQSPTVDHQHGQETRPAGQVRRRRLPRLLRNRWVLLYLALLALSHVVIAVNPRPAQRRARATFGAARLELSLPAFRADGPVEGRTFDLTVWRWAPSGPSASGRAPVVLLHGSPSSGGKDFAQFAPLLVAAGYTVFAPDLPGFGASQGRAPDYSIRANARLTLAALQDLGIERAHVVGWSLGGGAAMCMADLDPQRIASLTLLGSVGLQETEGSGDYFFERVKYHVVQALVVGLPEAIPHFGLLGPRASRRAFVRNYIDSDLRPMREVMERITAPTLLLHGRDDFLVPAWAAEEHHRVLRPSTLVILEGDHFLPLAPPLAREGQLEQVAAHVLPHLETYEAPRHALRGQARFARPIEPQSRSLGGVQISRTTPWWAVIVAISAGTFISEDLTIITIGLLMVSQSIDWGVGLIGCFVAVVFGDLALWSLGRFVGRRVLRWPLIRNMATEESIESWGRVLDAHTGKAVLLSRCLPGTRVPTFIAAGIFSRKAHHFAMWVGIAAFLWTPFLLGMTMIIGPSLLEFFRSVFHGPWAIVAAIIVLYAVIRLIGYETTPQGRDQLKADLRRFVSREFWPTWIFYLPLVPYLLWLSLRHRGLFSCTCANPGVPGGGGIVGESKSHMLAGFGAASRWALPARLIEEGEDPDARAQAAIDLIRAGDAVGGYPVIFKPDVGVGGAGVKIIRSDDDVHAYFRSTSRAVLMQRYHPGPYEVSLVWARRPTASKPVDAWPGEILSASAATFPVIEGDGKCTLQALIWRHPRYRMQAKVFLKRFAAQADRVLHTGERLQLALAGAHSQGTRLSDASRLVTLALAARIEEIAQAWRDPQTGGRLDFGRFDLRYADERELGAGEGFAIVELNGAGTESTSMYDPDRSVFWSYSVLFRHWRRLFRIGGARRREGVRPMSARELVRALRLRKGHGAPPRLSD